MILAFRSGVLQAVTLVRENKSSKTVKYLGEPNKRPVRVLNDSSLQKLFHNVDDAIKWQEGV